MCDDTKGVLEAVNQRKIDNAMVKRTKTIGQTFFYKTLHIKLRLSNTTAIKTVNS